MNVCLTTLFFECEMIQRYSICTYKYGIVKDDTEKLAANKVLNELTASCTMHMAIVSRKSKVI